MFVWFTGYSILAKQKLEFNTIDNLQNYLIYNNEENLE